MFISLELTLLVEVHCHLHLGVTPTLHDKCVFCHNATGYVYLQIVDINPSDFGAVNAGVRLEEIANHFGRCTNTALISLWKVGMFFTHGNGDMRSGNVFVVSAKVLTNHLISLRKERNIWAHQLVILENPVVTLINDIVAIDTMIPLLTNVDVGHTVEGCIGVHAFEVHLHPHAQSTLRIEVLAPNLQPGLEFDLLP